MSEDSVRVAVRVRPFNSREKDRKAKVIIQMQGQTTIISNPTNTSDQKKFAFDYSYWSHDGFTEKSDGILEATGSKYASQQKVFADLGRGVLDNAFEGYNCSLFAYGQTGSGKSYSMVGYGPNRGIVPITCDELFKSIMSNKDAQKRFEVTFSMLEIYNESIRDLLSKDNIKGGLSVRQHPNLGFYVQNLKHVPVGSYKEIENRMDQGTSHRTVAATNMNATSSRAHTVVTITFDQIIKTSEGETKKSSVMNLVDLAGSERADSTGATGDRLKEGANINKSLSSLGNVISALADISLGKKKVVVPYRDSKLTQLLQNALGGNSKTVMIAALSPADINYDETLSTLRYADRAKKIKNHATVNESPMDKLIRELRDENERLKQALSGGGMPMNTQGMTAEDIEKMRHEMEEEIRAQMMANMQMLEKNDESSWDAKLKEAQAETAATGGKEDKRGKMPHLLNLNEDPQLSGVIVFYMDKDKITVGRADDKNEPNISLKGLSISKNHALITKKKNSFEIKPGTKGAKTSINGIPLTGTQELQHKDRVLFGTNHMYVFYNPANTACDANLPAVIDWDFSQKEIAEAKGYGQSAEGLSREQQLIQEQVLEILPMVAEVNAISEELDKQRTFEVVLVSGAAQEGLYGQAKSTKVTIKMKNLLNENSWLWERGKFMNRRYLIQELYQRHVEGEDVSSITQEKDPFWEPPEDILIGTTNVFIQALGYCLDIDDKFVISDYKGVDEGSIYVNITPCTKQGKSLDDDSFVDEPNELLKKPYHFKVTVRRVEVKKSRYSKGLSVRYRVFKDETLVQTPTIKNTLEPEFKHTKLFSFPAITAEHLEFFENGYITFMVYGVQEDTLPGNRLAKLSTKERREMDRMMGTPDRQNTTISTDVCCDAGRLKSELAMYQRKTVRLEHKEKRLQQLCTEWGAKTGDERTFEPFYRAVSTLAHSTGTKFKTNAEIIVRMMKMKNLTKGGKGGPTGKGAKGAQAKGGGGADAESKACVVM